jgi:hypothetical protein
MSLELLDGLAKENIKQAPGGGCAAETLQRRALAVLGKMAMVYPRQPTTVDEKRMTLAVRRTMQLHFEYLPVAVPPGASGAGGGSVLYWPRPKNPLRSLELYERLPRGNAMRRDVRYLALSAASFLQGNDSGARFATLLSEEDEERASSPQHAGTNITSSLLLAATWALGCLCWDSCGIDSARWRAVFRPANEEGFVSTLRESSLGWVQRLFSASTSRVAVLYIVCGVLQRGGCPPLRHPQKFLDWCELELSSSPEASKCSVAEVVMTALVYQPQWKLEGSDADAVEDHRQSLLQVCCQAMLTAAQAVPEPDQRLVTCVVPRRKSFASSQHQPRMQMWETCVYPNSSIVVLHPSVGSMSESRFKELLTGVGTGRCCLVVPWELLSTARASFALQLRSHLSFAFSSFPNVAIAVVVDTFGPAPSIDSEPFQCVASALEAVLHAAAATSSCVSVWADDAAAASVDLKDILAASSRQVEVVGLTDLQRRQSLQEIQQFLSRDPRHVMKTATAAATQQNSKLRSGMNNIGPQANDGGLRKGKLGAAGGLRRAASSQPQQQKN